MYSDEDGVATSLEDLFADDLSLYSSRPAEVRLPRKINLRLSSRGFRRLRPQLQDSLTVEPRAFQVDHLPSTPQLNALMDRAMGKVKSMVKELEDEKGEFVS